MSLESYSSRFSFIHSSNLPCDGNREKIRFWEDLWLGDQPLCAQYTDLYRIILSRNLTISIVLGSSRLSTLNLIFMRNLTDLEIEHFQGLLLSLGFTFASYSPFVSSS